VGEYAFLPSASDKDQADVLASIKDFLEKIERAALPFINPDDVARLRKLQGQYEVPSTSDAKVSTQFSVGLNYWSPQHIDEDYFYTILSLLERSPRASKCQPGEPLHWFVFPDQNAAVPLNPGDILIFNPLVLHGCTNATIEGSLIFSAYVSAKTVATSVSQAMK
jgi:hypothetical protein